MCGLTSIIEHLRQLKHWKPRPPQRWKYLERNVADAGVEMAGCRVLWAWMSCLVRLYLQQSRTSTNEPLLDMSMESATNPLPSTVRPHGDQ